MSQVTPNKITHKQCMRLLHHNNRYWRGRDKNKCQLCMAEMLNMKSMFFYKMVD